MAKEQARIWLIVLLSISLLPFFQSTTTPPIDITPEDVYEDVKEHETKRDREEDSGWSEWSSWSVCSRSCNGGVTYQLRKCERKAGCQGEAAKYKICNMQPCPDSQDFRASQCAAYNPMPYRGRLYEWLPYQDPEDPCSLTCHARNFSFVAKLSPAVRDGTRCREGSLDMCVNGRCLSVGCDLQLGSTKKVDECGVCGGDGSTCRRPLYLWLNTPFSPCSVTCGGGYQMSRPTCLNKATGKEVDERLCDVTSRSPPEIRECNTQRCPAIWVTDSWSPCSASCGGGRQSRQVYCAQMGTDGIRSPTAVSQCLRQKPLTERPCNLLPCPQWISGPWSGCSVTCGLGLKTRSVACRDAKDQHSEDCDIEGMPATKQSCDSGLVCTPSKDPGTYLFSDIFKGSQEDAPPPAPLHSQPWTQRRIGSSTSSTEPSYVAGKWSPCTVTCGQGSRTRDVDCRIFLEFSKTDAKLPDKECPGPRPNDVEHCFPRPCALDQNKPDDNKILLGQEGIDVTYTWRMGGYTPCSASCLGGIRESIIHCFRDHDQAIVSPFKCDIRKKPDAITQTCNDHPCPPRWNVSEFSPCSKHCGGGYQLRDIQCLHEVTRGAANTLVISNSLCPQPPPTSKLLCNEFDCPTKWRTKWKTEAWMKCSKSCGGGEKMRKIRCVRELVFGQVVELDPSKCSKRRPKTVKVCNNKPCPPADDHVDDGIVPSHQTYVQKHPQRRVFLKVGGSAIVFAGTSLKIRCPNKKSNKTNILWYKDEEKLKPSRRVKVSMKGALRIRRIAYGDSGKYTCSTGYSTADIHITVKPLPPGSGRSEDDKTVERPEGPTDRKPPFKSPGQEYSHEIYHTSGEDNKSHFSNQPHQRENGQIDSQENPHPFMPENKPRTVDHSYDFGSTERIPMYVLAGRQPPVTGPPVDIHMFNTSNTRTSSATGNNSQGSREEEKNENNSRFRTKSKSNPKYHRPSEDKMVTSTSPRIPMYVLAGRQPPVTGPPVDIHMFNMSSTRTSSATGNNSQRSREEEKNENNSRFRTKSKSNPKYHRPSEDRMMTSASSLPSNSWEHQQQGTQSPEAVDSKPYDPWGRNHGENLFSDQESGELNIGTPHGDHGSFPILDAEQPARSGASSNHAGSHIQKILVNLHHTLGGSRATSSDVHDSNGDDDEVGDVMNPSRLMANSFVLGKGKPENLKFDWVITDWSPCSQSCGGNGFQVRECHCLVRLNNVSKTVDNRLCEDYGLNPPITVQACGTDDCPHWQTGPWSQCLEAHCFSWHSSYQKREIYCRMGNGTQLPHFHCDDKTRPRRKRECYNERCRSMWSVGEWSECTAACSRQGFQTRILQCVWYGSRKPAGNACHDQPRPSVMRPCIGPTCQSKEDCIDRSSYCSLAKTLHMCRLTHYQHQCCDSCREDKA